MRFSILVSCCLVWIKNVIDLTLYTEDHLNIEMANEIKLLERCYHPFWLFILSLQYCNIAIS